MMHYNTFLANLTSVRNLRLHGQNRNNQRPLTIRPLAVGLSRTLLLFIRGLVSEMLRIKRKEGTSGALDLINSYLHSSRHCRLRSTAVRSKQTRDWPLPLIRIQQSKLPFYPFQAFKANRRPGRTSQLLTPLRKQGLGPDIIRHKLMSMTPHLLAHRCMRPLQSCGPQLSPSCIARSRGRNVPHPWTARARVRASKASLRMQS